MNKLNYYYTRETVQQFVNSLSSFKYYEHGGLLFVYVDSWWAMFVWDRRQNKVQRDSTSAVLSVSCTKNTDQHKSCYGFQDVGNEGQLILAHSATFSTPGNIKTMTIWAYLLRNIYHKRHLSGPVSYWDFRETGPGLIRGSLRYS